MFRLTQGEWDVLRSQFVTANRDISKVRFTPYAFTEQGVAMLASVLSSQKAIAVNIQIMRAFIQLRNYVFANGALHEQVGDLRKLLMLHMENTDSKFSGYDEKIRQIVHALNSLVEQPPKTRTIGFRTD